MNPTDVGIWTALNRIADALEDMNDINRNIAGMVERKDL